MSGKRSLYVAAAVALGLPLLGASAAATGTVPPTNPASNIPTALYAQACFSPTNIPGTNHYGCASRDLLGIDTGRAAEGLGPMILPDGYLRMGVREQQWVVTNLERRDRGLPTFAGLDPLADDDSDTAAANGTDPNGSAIINLGSTGAIWAGSANPLGSDLMWMYYDGPGGSNEECTTTNMSGCWGHRDATLGDYVTTGDLTPIMGASSASQPDAQAGSEAEEFVGLTAPDGQTLVTYPKLTFPANNRPAIVSLSEAVGEAGDRVTVKGIGFTAATEIDFGRNAEDGSPATGMNVVDDSTITVTVPPGTGRVHVYVLTPIGHSEAVDFSYA